MLASVFSRINEPDTLEFETVGFRNTEKRGRLALSPSAMKVVAKRLETHFPLPSLMAGLRQDSANFPFYLARALSKDLTVVGDAGSGTGDMAYGFLYQASRAGFRTVWITSDPDAHGKGDPYEPWEPFGSGGDEYQRRLEHTRARLLDMRSGSVSDHDVAHVILKAFRDPATQHLILRTFDRHESPERYDKMIKGIIDGVRSYCEVLAASADPLFGSWLPIDDVVFAIPAAGLAEDDLSLLRRVSGGVISTISYQDADAWARPKGPVLLTKGRGEPTASLYPGGAFVVMRPGGDEGDVHNMLWRTSRLEYPGLSLTAGTVSSRDRCPLARSSRISWNPFVAASSTIFKRLFDGLLTSPMYSQALISQGDLSDIPAFLFVFAGVGRASRGRSVQRPREFSSLGASATSFRQKRYASMKRSRS